MRRKNKKHKLVAFLFSIMLIGIGYAYLTANLKITGTTKIGNAKFDVHFENAKAIDKSDTATFESNSNSNLAQGIPNIKGENATELEWAVTLNQPGDYYYFTADIVNDGDMFAYIDEDNTIVKYQIGDEEEKTLSFKEFFYYYLISRLTSNLYISMPYLEPGDYEILEGYVGVEEDISNEEWEELKGKTIKISIILNYKQGEYSDVIKNGTLNVKLENPVVNSIGSTTIFPSNNNTNIPKITNKSLSVYEENLSQNLLEYEVIFNSEDDYYEFTVDLVNANDDKDIGLIGFKKSIKVGNEYDTKCNFFDRETCNSEYFDWDINVYDDQNITYDDYTYLSRNKTAHVNVKLKLKDNLTNEQLNSILGKTIKVHYDLKYGEIISIGPGHGGEGQL